MRGRWLTLSLLLSPALAGAQGIAPGDGMLDQGTHNLQTLNRPAGDASVVQQTAGPGSAGNVQSATVSSPGDPPNHATQRTQGTGNTQSLVMQGGAGNLAVQSAGPGSAGSVQSAVITGTGNTVRQQTASGNVAIPRQRGRRTDGQDQGAE